MCGCVGVGVGVCVCEGVCVCDGVCVGAGVCVWVSRGVLGTCYLDNKGQGDSCRLILVTVHHGNGTCGRV